MTIQAELSQYIVRQYLKGNAPENFGANFNLIESGILTSLALFELLTHIEDKYALMIDLQDIVLENFLSINTISALVDKMLREQSKTAMS